MSSEAGSRSGELELRVDGEPVRVRAGTTVAVAVMRARAGVTRRSDRLGEPRGPLCGVGACFECRVTIDGRRHRRGCSLLCAAGMEVTT